MTPLPLYVNGRFAAQSLTGVQRFALETTVALQELLGDRVHPLVPPDAAGFPGARRVGKRNGQVWEQLELPVAARDGVLINLGNTAPLLARRQIVVIHDAGVFSTPEAYSRKFRLWYKMLHYALVRRQARIVTVSAFSRDELLRHLKLPADAVTVIPEGADHMLRLGSSDEILREHGLEPGKYVLAVGTLAKHKNLTALGPLAEQLAARGMVLAISGAFGAAAFQKNGTARLPAAARYLGRVSDEALKALFSKAACYVLPSYYEGFGLPAVEAMSCGCAVVAADIPALRQSCGTAAIYCNPANPEEFATTVLALIETPSRLESLRVAARFHVRNMTWSLTAQALCHIVEAAWGPNAAIGVASVIIPPSGKAPEQAGP